MNAPILIDVDGVVADFVGALLPEINAIGGYHYTPSDITEWDMRAALNLSTHEWAEVVAAIQEPGFTYSLDVRPGAKEAITSLKKNHDIVFLTSNWRGAKQWVYDRDHWLVKHFGSVGKNVIHTARKELVRGSVLVEDKPSSLNTWAETNPKGAPFLVDAAYNRSDDLHPRVRRTTSWAEIVQLIEVL